MHIWTAFGQNVSLLTTNVAIIIQILSALDF